MKHKVLVIEDNDLNLRLFRDLLELKNYEVAAYHDGDNILEITEKENPTLIIMDIQLKSVSGVDLIKILKESQKFKHIPIIAITALSQKNDVHNILNSGCDMFLSKPVSMDEFYNSVRKFLPETV